MRANRFGAGFTIIHAGRAEDLRDLLIAWMERHPLCSPLEREKILVHSKGMEQWLRLGIAGYSRGRIAAALDFALPGQFLWQSYRQILGDEPLDEASPFEKDRLTWQIYRILPRLVSGVEKNHFHTIRNYLTTESDQTLQSRRLFQLSRRLADLFDQYQVYRAHWLNAWAAGGGLAEADRELAAVESDQSWQPILWQALLEVIGVDRSRAKLHQIFTEKLYNADELESARLAAELPQRIIVAGISALPLQTIHALAALGRHCHVLLAVHNPCRYYWGDIVEERELLRREQLRARRPGQSARIDESLLEKPEELFNYANPLLASWGRQGRDTIALLSDYDRWEEYESRFRSHAPDAAFAQIDLFPEEPLSESATLLEQIQRAILDLEPLPQSDDDRPLIAAADRSLVIHICHSRQREVEALHDQLLRAFERHPGLSPGDVMVMVPDIESYAPHIEAVFGRHDSDSALQIPFSITDREESSALPLLSALEFLLALPERQLTVADFVALTEVQAFRRRFTLAESDLDKLRHWIESSSIRWGLSAEHRAALCSFEFDEYSWRFGLDRMVLGYAGGDEFAFADVEPAGEVHGLAAEAVGKLDLVIDQLEKYRQLFSSPGNADQWVERLERLLEDFFDEVSDEEARILSRLRSRIESWRESVESADCGSESFGLLLVREAVWERGDYSSASRRFLSGSVNFGTLMPMRAIPFQVIALLGMNDGDYPRSQDRYEFDLMLTRPMAGDRSRRDDDRYLFLEALLSARRELWISYLGRSSHDNSPKPPSTLVAELQSYIERGWRFEKGAELTVEHPLQPFSERLFTEEALKPEARLFTYAAEWRHSDPDYTSKSSEIKALPPLSEEKSEIKVYDLANFLRNPADYLYRERFGISISEKESHQEQESFALNALEDYSLHADISTDLLRRYRGKSAELPISADELYHTLRRRGRIPLHAGGREVAAKLHRELTMQWRKIAELDVAWPEQLTSLFFRIELDANRRLEDVLADLRTRRAGGSELSSIAPIGGRISDKKGQSERTKVKFYRLMDGYLHYLLLNASGAKGSVHLVAADTSAIFDQPIKPSKAIERLREIEALRQRALTEPLPLCSRTAFAWYKALDKAIKSEQAKAAKKSKKKVQAPEGEKSDKSPHEQAEEAARQAYEGGYNISSNRDRSLYLAHHFPDFDILMGAGFLTLSKTLYDPILKSYRHEQHPEPEPEPEPEISTTSEATS